MANKTLRSNINTITRGYAGGGSSSNYRREYTRQMSATNVISHGFPKGAHGEIRINITFFDEDIIKVNPHDNDPMIIIVQHDNWDIMRVLIDYGNSTDVMF